MPYSADMLPIQASLSGGSSSAKSDTKYGDNESAGGSGSRGATFNIATGGSSLSSAQGAGGTMPSTNTLLLIGGAAVAYLVAKKKGWL